MTRCTLTVEDALAWTRENWPLPHMEMAEIVLRVYRLRDHLFANARSVMEEQGLTPAEFDTLCSLRRQPPPHESTPSTLCTAIWLTSGGMAKTLNHLEARGLIERAISAQDRRSRIVRLTETGRRLIEAAMIRVLAGHHASITAALSPAEREQLTALLRKLLGAVEAAR